MYIIEERFMKHHEEYGYKHLLGEYETYVDAVDYLVDLEGQGKVKYVSHTINGIDGGGWFEGITPRSYILIIDKDKVQPEKKYAKYA